MQETSPKAVPVTGQLQAVRQGVRSSLLVPGDTREVSLIHLLTGLADRVSRSTSHLLLQTVGYSLEHRGEIHCINIHPSQPFTNTQRTPKIDLTIIYTSFILYTGSMLGKMKAEKISRLERVSFSSANSKSHCETLVF